MVELQTHAIFWVFCLRIPMFHDQFARLLIWLIILKIECSGKRIEHFDLILTFRFCSHQSDAR